MTPDLPPHELTVTITGRHVLLTAQLPQAVSYPAQATTNVTESPAAYDVDALKYEDGSYWFRVAETGEWKELHWGGEHKNETSQTGHQLVFYYACRYINNDIADVFTSDWGEPNYSGVVNIYFKLYEVTGSDYDNAELLDEDWDGFANGIKVIVGVQDPSFEVVRSVVDYADSTEEDKIYPGQITDNPAVVAGKECTVKIYVRKKATFSVTYDWLNNPPGTTPARRQHRGICQYRIYG